MRYLCSTCHFSLEFNAMRICHALKVLLGSIVWFEVAFGQSSLEEMAEMHSERCDCLEAADDPIDTNSALLWYNCWAFCAQNLNCFVFSHSVSPQNLLKLVHNLTQKLVRFPPRNANYTITSDMGCRERQLRRGGADRRTPTASPGGIITRLSATAKLPAVKTSEPAAVSTIHGQRHPL